VPDLDVVFLDVGGPLYGDRPYYQALFRAIWQQRPEANEEEFWQEFEACRRDQWGPFTKRLVTRFLPEDRYEDVVARGRELWTYPPDSLQPDVREGLRALHGRYRLGILANQMAWIRKTMERDGIAGFFEIWAVSEEVGAEKPDPAIFRFALDRAGAPPDRCAMVGDRLDNDVEAARGHGMKGVWLLRGEAPDNPTAEQLERADAAIKTLLELPDTLGRLQASG
jgi:HAD superfamily hydrolase (TIGR01662 family)